MVTYYLIRLIYLISIASTVPMIIAFGEGLSGRVLDSRSWVTVSSLTKGNALCPLLSTGSTQEDPPDMTEKLFDWDIVNTNKRS